MPVIVVTRLRLKDPAFFDEFFANAVAVVEQAQNSAHLVASGQAASLTDATEANHTRGFPAQSCPHSWKPVMEPGDRWPSDPSSDH